MVEELETALLGTIGERYVPRAYVDFQMCRELGLTPRELAEMPEHQYRLWLGFLNAEGYAQTHEQRRSEFRSGGA